MPRAQHSGRPWKKNRRTGRQPWGRLAAALPGISQTEVTSHRVRAQMAIYLLLWMGNLSVSAAPPPLRLSRFMGINKNRAHIPSAMSLGPGTKNAGQSGRWRGLHRGRWGQKECPL